MSIGKEKITRENAWGEKIIFFPNSPTEAAHLQEKLMVAGFKWADGDTKVCELERCQKHGLVIKNGLMYVKGPKDTENYTACPVKQVDEDLVPQGDRMMEMFNTFAAQLARVEQRLAAIEAPDALDKPRRLKVPEGRAP